MAEAIVVRLWVRFGFWLAIRENDDRSATARERWLAASRMGIVRSAAVLGTDPTMTIHPDDSLQIFVYSRAHIELLAPHDDAAHVIISITTTPSDVARLPVCDRTLGVLRLSFFDLDGPAHGVAEEELFGCLDAAKIWDLLELHRPKLERVLVHCDAGYSRSPAVAAAIARVYCGDDAQYFRRYQPNRRVHRLLLEEAVSRGLL